MSSFLPSFKPSSYGDIGPNISNQSDHFFQSDRDLAKQASRDAKFAKSPKAGSPILLPSKVLAMVTPENQSSYVYLAESGGTIRKLDLQVRINLVKLLQRRMRRKEGIVSPIWVAGSKEEISCVSQLIQLLKKTHSPYISFLYFNRLERHWQYLKDTLVL